jgi:hypothetical protein
MVYLKSLLAGAAAFVLTVSISSAVVIAIMIHAPQLALRIFPAGQYEIGWGAYYYVNFPLRQILIAGLVAFAITVARMLKRASARM